MNEQNYNFPSVLADPFFVVTYHVLLVVLHMQYTQSYLKTVLN